MQDEARDTFNAAEPAARSRSSQAGQGRSPLLSVNTTESVGSPSRTVQLPARAKLTSSQSVPEDSSLRSLSALGRSRSDGFLHRHILVLLAT